MSLPHYIRVNGPDDRALFTLAIIDSSDLAHEVFEERELQGGGYTWHGLAYSLVSINLPEHLQSIEFDSEGDGLYVTCSSVEPLNHLAGLVHRAMEDRNILLEAIDAAGDDIE